MNWGRGLMLVFGGFALLIGALVYGAMHTKYELVTKEYYRDELRYQQNIDGQRNAAAAGAISLTKSESDVVLELPSSLAVNNVTADAWFYCRTNSAADRRTKVNVVNGRYIFPRKDLAATQYELKLQFEAAGKNYYYTSSIDLR